MRRRLADRRRARRKFKARQKRLGNQRRPAPTTKAITYAKPAAAATKKAAAAAAAAIARAVRPTVMTTTAAAEPEPAPLDTPLSQIGLTEELIGRLDNAGITTIGNIRGWSAGTLAALRIKANHVRLIRERLKVHGHYLKGEEPTQGGTTEK